MKNKFIRVLSPITLLVIGVLDIAIIAFGVFAVEKLITETSKINITFAVIETFAIIIGALVSKEVVSNGVNFCENEFEFTGLDDNNVFNYSDIEKVETSKDTKASLKKNFVDRYSSVTLYLKDETVTTISLGLTTVRTLTKIRNEILSRIKDNA